MIVNEDKLTETRNIKRQEHVNLLREEINSLIIENEELKKMLSLGKEEGYTSLNEKYKNYELFLNQYDLGEYTEQNIIKWDPDNITKNIEVSDNPNNDSIYARDYDLDFFKKRVEVKSSAAKKYFKDEEGKWRQRHNIASDYNGNFRFSAKNIRKNNLWDYLIFVVYYLDKEDMYLFKYDEVNTESLGVSLSPLNVNQSKENDNYQFTITHQSINKIEKFKKTKEEIMEILGEENEEAH